MATACEMKDRIQGHPCFGGNHKKNGRMHLAVAPACNIKCGYCTRKHDCANESRPGVTSRLLTPQEAIVKVREVMASPIAGPIVKVVGIAGPGDPLANEQTFETFAMVKKEFPHLMLCMSTNGLLLPESIDRLYELGLHSLTVTINAVDPEVGALDETVHPHRRRHGRRHARLSRWSSRWSRHTGGRVVARGDGVQLWSGGGHGRRLVIGPGHRRGPGRAVDRGAGAGGGQLAHGPGPAVR